MVQTKMFTLLIILGGKKIREMKRAKFTFLLSLLILSCSRNSNFNTSNNEIHAKVDSLISIMTLKEKIGQTIMYSGDWDVTGPVVSSNNMKLLRDGNLGAMFNVFSAKKTKEFRDIITIVYVYSFQPKKRYFTHNYIACTYYYFKYIIR